jgi:hypothetical protein
MKDGFKVPDNSSSILREDSGQKVGVLKDDAFGVASLTVSPFAPGCECVFCSSEVSGL